MAQMGLYVQYDGKLGETKSINRLKINWFIVRQDQLCWHSIVFFSYSIDRQGMRRRHWQREREVLKCNVFQVCDLAWTNEAGEPSVCSQTNSLVLLKLAALRTDQRIGIMLADRKQQCCVCLSVRFYITKSIHFLWSQLTAHGLSLYGKIISSRFKQIITFISCVDYKKTDLFQWLCSSTQWEPQQKWFDSLLNQFIQSIAWSGVLLHQNHAITPHIILFPKNWEEIRDSEYWHILQY